MTGIDDWAAELEDPLGIDKRPEPDEATKARIVAAAKADIARYEAERAERIYDPSGPRQRKKRQRRILFDQLRSGKTLSWACGRAGVDRETFDRWCERPSFRAAVERAQQVHLDEFTPTLG